MFSIIIPAYNEEKYITNCLRSVLALNKTLDYEVIVVNNASTDRTPEIVKEVLPEAKLIDEPRKGLTIAYNRGAREAKGEILVFVDADVVLPPNHLEKISKEFKKDPKLVALSGPYIYKDGGAYCRLATFFAYVVLAMPSEIIFNRFLHFGTGIISGNSAMKREAFEQIGGFNENLFYGLDTDISLRLRRWGKVRFKPYFSVESSTRRLKKEGVLRMITRYTLNIIWPYFFKKPFTKDYIDVR